MLGNSIALFTLALMLASEATRAAPPWNRGLWTLATIVALLALGLRPLTERMPAIEPFLSSIFGQPVAWFVLAIGLFFVLKPFWAKKPDTSIQDAEARIKPLGESAFRIARYITQYRATKRVFRSDLPHIQPAVMEGISLTISLQKEGISTPKFGDLGPYATALAMQHFFSIIAPLIRDGHIDELRADAEKIVKGAEQIYSQFNPDEFWTSNDW